MANVSLKPTQVAVLSNLSDSEIDTGPVFTEFVAAIKQQYGIPAEHKLRTGNSDHSHPDYPTLYRKKTGEAYPIDPATGRWVGATAPAPSLQATTTRAAYVPEYRWFGVYEMAEINDMVDTIVGDLDFGNGYIEIAGGNPVEAFEIDGYKFEVTGGQLYIRLEKSEF